jgi:acyl-CoA thioesterase
MEHLTIWDFFRNDAFAAAAGVELLEAGDGYARARMAVRPMHLNGGGVCQGGAIFTLADLAFAVAANSHARLTFSITSDIHFFKSENAGFLYAEAHEIYNHNRLSHCEVKVTNEQGELIATFNGTGYRKETPLPFDPLTSTNPADSEGAFQKDSKI